MKKYLPVLLSFVLLFSLSVVFVHAQTSIDRGNNSPTSIDRGSNNPSTIPNPFRRTGGSLLEFLQAIFDGIIMPIGALIAVCAFVYAGFLYVTSAGNQSKVKGAHSAFINAAIGTALLLGAEVLSKIIIGTVNQFK